MNDFDLTIYEQARDSLSALMGTGRMDLVVRLLQEQLAGQMGAIAGSVKALPGGRDAG